MVIFVTDTQRRAIVEHGTPLPLVDGRTGDIYVLLSVQFTSDPLSGLAASIPGIAAYGEGETKQEASLALCEALRGFLDALGGA